MRKTRHVKILTRNFLGDSENILELLPPGNCIRDAATGNVKLAMMSGERW
jgi:hypothetical protein